MNDQPGPSEPRGATVGRKLGDFVRRARESGAPEAERLARQAKQLAETNLPHVKQASQQALSGVQRFAQEHDDEFRQAGLQAARLLASRSVPLPLQPVVAAATEDLARRTQSSKQREQPRVDTPTPKTPRKDEPLIF